MSTPSFALLLYWNDGKRCFIPCVICVNLLIPRLIITRIHFRIILDHLVLPYPISFCNLIVYLTRKSYLFFTRWDRNGGRHCYPSLVCKCREGHWNIEINLSDLYSRTNVQKMLHNPDMFNISSLLTKQLANIEANLALLCLESIVWLVNSWYRSSF